MKPKYPSPLSTSKQSTRHGAFRPQGRAPVGRWLLALYVGTSEELRELGCKLSSISNKEGI